MAATSQSKKNVQKSGIKRFLPLLIIILIILAVSFGFKFITRTVPNDPGAVGNSACNLYNGGTFVTDEKRIYFSNPKDDGALYSMNMELSDFKRLNDDRPGFLNVTNHYLVYARENYKREGGGHSVLQYTNSGVFRVDKKNGSSMRMIYSEPVGGIVLSGNDIYYQHYDKKDGLDLYRASLDTSVNEMLLDDKLIPASIWDGQLYYAGTEKDHYIYSLTPGKNAASSTETLIYKGNCYQPARVGDSIYFISLSENYSIARIDAYGSHPTLLVQERCSSYNVDDSENYLIYQVDDGVNSRLEWRNLNTLETVTVANGNFNNIHIVGKTVFYQEFGTTRQYYFRLDAPAQAALFTPPEKKIDLKK